MSSFPELLVLLLGLRKLPALPVDLPALAAPPEIVDRAALVGEVHLLHGLFSPDDHQLWVVALDAARKGLDLAEVQPEHLNELFEYRLAVALLLHEVDRDVGVLVLDQFAVTGHQDPLLFPALGNHQIVIFY